MYNREYANMRGYRQIRKSLLRAGAPEVVATLPCRVAHIGTQSYGKLPSDAIGDQIFMEYKHFIPYLAKYLPPGALALNQFSAFLRDTTRPNKYFDLADFLMLTLPGPRIDYYKSSDFYEIHRAVTAYANQVVEALGFFPLRM